MFPPALAFARLLHDSRHSEALLESPAIWRKRVRVFQITVEGLTDNDEWGWVQAAIAGTSLKLRIKRV